MKDLNLKDLFFKNNYTEGIYLFWREKVIINNEKYHNLSSGELVLYTKKNGFDGIYREWMDSYYDSILKNKLRITFISKLALTQLGDRNYEKINSKTIL